MPNKQGSVSLKRELRTYTASQPLTVRTTPRNFHRRNQPLALVPSLTTSRVHSHQMDTTSPSWGDRNRMEPESNSSRNIAA